MAQQKIVVLGAGYGGMLAALRLAGKTDAAITLVNSSPFFVERIRLHQVAAGQTVTPHPIAKLLSGTAVRFVEGVVTALDHEHITYTQDKTTHTLPYDTLIYALGSTIDRESVPGVREFAHVLSPDGAQSLRQRLSALPEGAPVVVGGGGLTGIEAASEFAEAYPHLHVLLVTQGRFGERLSRKGEEHLRRVFHRLGVTLVEDTTIKRVETGGVITEQSCIPADVTLWAGAFGVSPLAGRSGIAVNGRGQIVVDKALRSVSHPSIYAVGDAADTVEHPSPIRMACATAMPMAAQAADNIAAMLKSDAPQPFSMRYYFQCISLGRGDGLIQRVEPDDTPIERVITGRAAALFKEMICRFAFNSLRLERRLPGVYRIPAAPVIERAAYGDV